MNVYPERDGTDEPAFATASMSAGDRDVRLVLGLARCRSAFRRRLGARRRSTGGSACCGVRGDAASSSPSWKSASACTTRRDEAEPLVSGRDRHAVVAGAVQPLLGKRIGHRHSSSGRLLGLPFGDFPYSVWEIG